MKRRVLLHANMDADPCVTAAGVARQRLEEAGFDVLGSWSGEEPAPEVIVLLGGDGFLMESLRQFDYPPSPIFGINFGTVGFLMNSHTCVADLPAILTERDFREEVHPVLRAETRYEDGRSAEAYAFNEFVLERQTGQAVRLEVYVDDILFNRFAGDGFVVSTPAGSTAYNLAAGGPAVHPSVSSMVLTPLYAHRAEPFHSAQFSLVLPTTSEIRVETQELGKRHVRMMADGQPHDRVARVIIRDSGRRVRLLRTPGREFTRMLTEKFIGHE